MVYLLNLKILICICKYHGTNKNQRTKLNPGSKPIRNMLLNLVQNFELKEGAE